MRRQYIENMFKIDYGHQGVAIVISRTLFNFESEEKKDCFA